MSRTMTPEVVPRSSGGPSSTPREQEARSPEALLSRVDLVRIAAAERLDAGRRSALGQFMTPVPVARLMASMFEPRGNAIRLLDAGAGVGSLTVAFVAERCLRRDESVDAWS